MTLVQILLFLPAAAVVAASPGANNLLAFANGSRQGFLPSAIALLGRCLAFVIMIAIVIVGLGALLETSEIAFQIIKWAGVVYLVHLSVTMIIARNHGSADDTRGAQRTYDLARREFLVAMTNPKAVLLFTAFVPQFITRGGESSFTVQLIVLGAIYIALEFIAAMGWALAGSIIRSLQPSAKRMLLLNRMTGALMLGAAGMLAFTRRA
ncbi:LysE family translocator [Rhizobium sp. SL86]|jgi:threonine/homoserine/homoserine lactone efflux protein|uniref:LysE family translocator n=1 Tax=Rhizobium sp. SL86 TaxID=2995148 RepID=UPI002274B467|nr:LysE family translocator [Rhizobium sp. SL86]MCY1668870.1 LysE family translocator [Rhizobium sp. SL86]